MEEQNVVFRRKRKPNYVIEISTILLLCLLGYMVFTFSLPIFRDWQRTTDMTALQQLLGKDFEAYRSYPEFTGILDGEDALNRELRTKGLFSGSFSDPKGKYDKKSNFQYYYSSNGSSYLINFCLETSWFKGGHEGCNNQILFSQ